MGTIDILSIVFLGVLGLLFVIASAVKDYKLLTVLLALAVNIAFPIVTICIWGGSGVLALIMKIIATCILGYNSINVIIQGIKSVDDTSSSSMVATYFFLILLLLALVGFPILGVWL